MGSSISAGISRPRRGHPLPAADNFLPERDPGSACRHGPSRAIAVMGRHERFHSELAAGFEAQKKKANLDGDVLLSVWTKDKTSAWLSTAAATGICLKELEEHVPSCRSREAAATARLSLLRELASAGNYAGLDVAPSYSRGRGETCRTGPNAPLELA